MKKFIQYIQFKAYYILYLNKIGLFMKNIELSRD